MFDSEVDLEIATSLAPAAIQASKPYKRNLPQLSINSQKANAITQHDKDSFWGVGVKVTPKQE